MAEPKEQPRGASFAQFLAISVLAVLAIIGWDFGHRLLAMRDLLDQNEATQVQLDNAMQTNEQLLAMKQMVQSDSWVERYVRIRWHWERDGETMLIPISPSAAPQPVAPAVKPPPPPPPKPAWRDFLDNLVNAILGPIE